MTIKTKHLQRVLQYINDKREGEIIESVGYGNYYLNIATRIKQKDLDEICDLVTKYICKPNEACTNRAGEFFFSIIER